ncbi:MAG: class I SAM-dependent methyltransferase [Bacteroidales bacterium]|nr:class I SAM-dependent methyltransferase [Bacteroidales bacterium]
MKKTIFIGIIAIFSIPCFSQQKGQADIDKKVETFFQKHGGWNDMNVPASDGKLLYNLILENNYQQALEIGTSTGHATIWMAWALSKTGGKLITIEIDKTRHQEALDNFKKAGVDHIIDARLANAHELVPNLKGPFDFVFSDADKGWYQRYFEAVDPKLKVGGCYTTHNVSDRPGVRWNQDYLVFLQGLNHYETTVNNSGGGMAISFKKAVSHAENL